MISRSFLSTRMSLKYQSIGFVRARTKFLLIPVTGIQVVLRILAVCSMIYLKLSLSGPTASRSKFSLVSRHLTIRSAISSTCTQWKMQFPSPGSGKTGKRLIRQAMLFIMMLSLDVLPKMAQGFTKPQLRPDSLMYCSTLAFSRMQSKGEFTEVWVWEVQTIFFTPASLAQSISILELLVTCSRLRPNVLSKRTQQVCTSASQPFNDSSSCFRSNLRGLSIILVDWMFQGRLWLVRLTICAPLPSMSSVTYLPVQDCAPVMAIFIIKLQDVYYFLLLQSRSQYQSENYTSQSFRTFNMISAKEKDL